MNRPTRDPADSKPIYPTLQSSDPERWWQSAITDSLEGKLPFPPQGELTLRKYAQVVEKRRFFLPEILVNRYFIAGLNVHPPLAERERLVSRPFHKMVDSLSQRELRGATRSSSSATLPVIPEGRLLAVATLGDQPSLAATPETPSTSISLHGKRGRHPSWESASESSCPESSSPAVSSPVPVTVPVSPSSPVTSLATYSAPRPRRKKRRKGPSGSPSLPPPEPVMALQPAAEVGSAVPCPAAVSVAPVVATGDSVLQPAAESAFSQSALGRSIPETCTVNVVSESSAVSAEERAAVDSAARAVVQSVSAHQEMPVIIAARTLSEYLSRLARILDVPVSPVSSPVPVSNAPESADPSPETVSADPKSAIQSTDPKPAAVFADPKSATQSADPKPAAVFTDPKSATPSTDPKPAAVFTDPKSATPSTDLKPAAVFTDPKPVAQSTVLKSSSESCDRSPTAVSAGPKPADLNADPRPAATKTASPSVLVSPGSSNSRSVSPFVPVPTVPGLPFVSPVMAQPRTVFPLSHTTPPKPARSSRPKPTPCGPRTSVPPTHPRLSRKDIVFPPPPLPFGLVPCLMSP
ncbi:flocculation protein FLO11-like [Pimephales promelas]|uniref:flocculation protein FLO11-like n=1 Tax=Pimephales promelas TaxID=90988 RepID=UPI0019559E0A|nr:flocculation protein FLO11-like [Pimephales promelas]